MEQKHIYLIGFMGAGKSTVAKALAKKTGLPVMEMDDVIASRAGMPIREIFARQGEEAFRKQEAALLAEIADGEPAIVSCGGGLIKLAENISVMRSSGTVVCLTATPETILSRVAGDSSRPLLQGKKDIASIAAMIAERAPLYERAYDFSVKVDGRTPEEIADSILAALPQKDRRM